VHVNAIRIPVVTIPGIRRGGHKGEQWRGVNSSMIDLLYHKILCKCHSVPLPSTTIKEKKNKDCFLPSFSEERSQS
jgi:hypothetical protein